LIFKSFVIILEVKAVVIVYIII